MSIAEILNEEFCVPTLLQRMGGVSCSGVSLFEDENSYILEAKVPGVKAEEIKVNFERGHVLIEALAKQEKEGVKVHFKSPSNYSYLIPLPEERIDATVAPEAVCKDGILTITFAKTKVSKPLNIAVRSI